MAKTRLKKGLLHPGMTYLALAYFALTLLLALLALLALPALACDPPRDAPRSVKERLAVSDVVFLGTPVSFKNEGVIARFMGVKKQRVRFKVSKRWKGQPSAEAEVYDDSTSCGMGFSKLLNKAKVLIYGKIENGLVKPHISGGVLFYERAGVESSFAQAKEEIKELDRLVEKSSRGS